MFPTVAEHRGWRIERRPPGFEFTPGLLGKISAYLAVAPDGVQIAFAFMYSFFETDGPSANEDELGKMGVEAIRQALDSSAAKDATSDHTYELTAAGWVEVDRPRWWISVRGGGSR